MSGLRLEDRGKPSHVYFVVMCGQRRFLKVGIALNIQRRMRDLKNYMPMARCRLVHSVVRPNRFQARQLEAAILFWFRDKRVNGSEWVEIDDEVRGFLRRIKSGEQMEPTIFRGAAKMATRPFDKYYRDAMLELARAHELAALDARAA